VVCVRAETMFRPGGPMSVAVVGSRRAAGSTTLAATMANEFEVSGSKVMLIDADPRTSELSDLFATDMISIADFMADIDETHRDSLVLASLSAGLASLDSSPALGAQVVGIKTHSDVEFLRHGDLRKLVTRAEASFGVIVIDGGPLLDTVTARKLVEIVDVVVLALPERYQSRADLPFIRHQLSDAGVRPLAVLMPTGHRPRKRGHTHQQSQTADA
jgi:cellulose biosynthesis protein BcsQ